MPIEVDSVSYVYMEGTPFESIALDDVSLRIEEGDFFLIVGSTGSGKSTLLQHLNALLMPTRGKVVVDGMDTRIKQKRNLIRKTVGMVFQYPEDQFFEENVYKEVAFGPRNMGMSEEEIPALVRWACEMVGMDYDYYKDAYPFDLSGGERRKIAIASVLAMKPSYLALDEPLAGLDPLSRRDMLKNLCDIRRHGTTIIIVTHDVDDVVPVANKMAVFSRGKMVAYGSPHDVFDRYPFEIEKLGVDLPITLKISAAIESRCGVKFKEPIFDLKILAGKILEVKDNIEHIF